MDEEVIVTIRCDLDRVSYLYYLKCFTVITAILIIISKVFNGFLSNNNIIVISAILAEILRRRYVTKLINLMDD